MEKEKVPIIPVPTVTSIKDLVRILAPTDIDGTSIEIEVRFGVFGKTFISGVSRATFNRVKESILKLNPKFIYIHSKDEIFRNKDTPGWPYDQNTTERYTTIFNEQGLVETVYCLVKSRVQNFDVPDYSFRISVSKETTIESPKPSSQPILIREKKRWSVEFYQRKFRIDMTEVTTYNPGDNNPNLAETVFEIEIEILPPKLENLDFFAEIINIFLKEIQGTIIVYTSQEKRDIITRTNDLIDASINTPYSIDINALIQPRNLKVRDLAMGEIIPTTNRGVRFTVTIKTDGIHRLLVIEHSGIYLIYADQVNKIADSRVTGKLKTWHGTVFECEYVPKSNILPGADSKYHQALVYAPIFDCITTSKKSGVWNEDQSNRMEYAQKFMSTMQGLTFYIFEPKEFEPFSTVDEFYRAVNKVLTKTYPCKTDGCMFQPDNYRYDPTVNLIKDLSQRRLSRRPDIMKWKPPSDLTIDFAISHVPSADGNYIELQVLEGNQLITFDGTPFDSKKDIQIIPKLQNAPNGSIVEFRWTYENVDAGEDTKGKFTFVKFRDDKPYPNKRRVAIDVWEDIHKPIDEATIRGQKFSLSFRYHNREKWNIFNMIGKALPPAKVRVLLDIGSGRGGDLDKWVANGFTHIICIEPNDKNREELSRRIETLNQVRQNEGKDILQCRIVATVGQDWENIVKHVREFSPTGYVDTISCMLSLSFFFDSSQSTLSIIYLVHNTLSRGGYFIALSIDGRHVLEYFNNVANFIEVNGVRRSYMQSIDFQLRPATPEVNLLHVFINIPNSIVTNQIEYLTNLPELQQLLGQIQPPLILINEWRTDKEIFLIKEEIQYVGLFTAFIMQRK